MVAMPFVWLFEWVTVEERDDDDDDDDDEEEAEHDDVAGCWHWDGESKYNEDSLIKTDGDDDEEDGDWIVIACFVNETSLFDSDSGCLACWETLLRGFFALIEQH